MERQAEGWRGRGRRKGTEGEAGGGSHGPDVTEETLDRVGMDEFVLGRSGGVVFLPRYHHHHHHPGDHIEPFPHLIPYDLELDDQRRTLLLPLFHSHLDLTRSRTPDHPRR